MDQTRMQTKKYSHRRILWTIEKINLEEAKMIYQSLENQISLLKENIEVILGGDFNAKQEINTKKAKQEWKNAPTTDRRYWPDDSINQSRHRDVDKSKQKKKRKINHRLHTRHTNYGQQQSYNGHR